jgi:glutamate N-acetyltransferase/amino-acid N-acetyltransferase
MNIIKGGITTPKGYKAYGDYIGLKKKRKDMSIVYSEKRAEFAATFTTNIVKAAPVLWNMDLFNKDKKISAIVVNSGNANACTGEQGIKDTETMAKVTANEFGIDKENVIVASTGVIGVELPMDIIEKGIKTVAKKVDSSFNGGRLAAEGIMTTDTFLKQIAVEFEIDGKKAYIGGMAKGSGMIHPNMATMLSFVTTDVAITKEMLNKALKEDVQDTYNMISVDGDTSTNDMLVVLANGMCDNKLIDSDSKDYTEFKKALNIVNEYLAKQIVQDGEGVTKFIEVNINGAKDKNDARLLAKSIITSNLVKTAFFGQDANWGRILCAMGYSGAKFDTQKVVLDYESDAGSINLLSDGVAQKFDESEALKILQEKNIKVNITLEEGDGKASAWGCDLSYEYVRINGDYRT